VERRPAAAETVVLVVEAARTGSVWLFCLATVVLVVADGPVLTLPREVEPPAALSPPLLAPAQPQLMKMTPARRMAAPITMNDP
jgi:hypothetical protein